MRNPVHFRHVLLREAQRGRRIGVRLDTSDESDRLRDRILARFRANSVADDGRDFAGEDPWLGRQRRDGLQLDVHVHRDENLRGRGEGDRSLRSLLAVRLGHYARFHLRGGLRAGDPWPVPRGDREEIQRPREKDERGRQHETHAAGYLTGRLSYR